MGGRRKTRAQAEREGEVARMRRELLRDAITDIQGSIHANDTKSSAALVVHGLLFAGTLTLTREVAPVFEQAQTWQRWVIAIVLVLALIAFLVSIGALLRAISPYHPSDLRRRIANGHPQVFFPLLYDLAQNSTAQGTNELAVFKKKIEALAPDAIEADYAAELLKLAEVRRHEADWARWGYRALMLELLAVATYLVFTASVAITHLD